jgi:ABC-type bacteriocin/lantibiotic exporter with double-glycine peptidase domain
LLSDAPYLILDEPAAALDAIATENLIRVLKDFSQGRTLIVIGHTPSILPLAERAVILENGSVSAQGPVNELIHTSSFLQAFVGGKEDAE